LIQKDPSVRKKNDEKYLGPEVPYLSTIEVLMYLANNMIYDIIFYVNVLARYSSEPTRRH
jgi:hypothetical protein